MGYELIITEKPNAAKKIAEALANGKPIRKGASGVYYYEVTHGNKDLVIGCAVGHLYTVAETEKKKGWSYPVFDIKWEESGKAKKESAFTKKYLAMLKKLSKDATEFTVATDYDVEGEVIGLNVVRYACKKKDANRMKFSTLTKGDLVEAYEKKMKHLDWGQAIAGETRHFLDWMYGINLSRALTLSIKHSTGMHKILSSGRVQGPALKIIVDKELSIQAFKPEPFWELELKAKVKGGALTATHNENPFWNKEKASTVLAKVKPEKKGVVKNVAKNEFKQAPPTPFDLTTLQTEAYRTHGISPSITQQLAQNLYLDGAISYPRTSSQQLPPAIGYAKIIKELSKQENYVNECKMLAGKELKPNNGQKTDPAHPAIYPTGSAPTVKGNELRVYDLIVRRFLATFGEPAVRETVKIEIDIKEELFISKGTRTTKKGWHELYGRYATQKEEELPKVEQGQTVDVDEVLMHDKETQPPKRYTQASIIKELEKKGLGTKATRSTIVDNLFQRGYAAEKAIKATNLGIKTVETLEKYCPEILDEELTRNFELEMEQIREEKKKEEEILDEAKAVLTKTLAKFKDNEKAIGEKLAEASRETQREMSLVGPCPVCKDGNLMIKRGKYGMFIACDNYPNCSITFKLPSNALSKPSEKKCEKCGYPMILVIKRKARPQELCINPECESKKIESAALQREADKVESGKIEKKCPKCGKNLVLRHSIYGSFYGCSGYPKCRYTENIDGSTNGKKTEQKE
ncbi:DNA topoisomerase I [Candidatus Woesearchaeota archaeon]|nr:DNA topoisomerase I [Candidatus Woesearchaeota archaeon]